MVGERLGLEENLLGGKEGRREKGGANYGAFHEGIVAASAANANRETPRACAEDPAGNGGRDAQVRIFGGRAKEFY
jgi:hypothetical protein